ncbi:MAG: hypothetical protein VKL23_04985 [Cyanobacteriota bacterium]|nr:hypothetical protein [Cyanobacteriota bacterium]
MDDPLAIDPAWATSQASGLSLTPLEDALQLSVLGSGLTRDQWLRRLAGMVHSQALLPLLWLLPKRWRLAPALLPERFRALAAVLECGLLNPLLLAALADDLPHLFPATAAGSPSAVERWRGCPAVATVRELRELHTNSPTEPDPSRPPADHPQNEEPGLLWRNRGLNFAQPAGARACNSAAAQMLNRLGANLLGGHPYLADGCRSASAWVGQLQEQGWQAQARLRASVASFGIGASIARPEGGWSQVPLALPYRTGLPSTDGSEQLALLPHSCLELELRGEGMALRLQYYQGTEGLCGWAGLNDLVRPWQNGAENGTVRHLGQPLQGDSLVEALDLCDVIALVHNLEASERALQRGGYGTLGFCIDSSALIQQALEGRCELFPVLLGGIWRERLEQRAGHLAAAGQLPAAHGQALERYRQALAQLPLDLALHGQAARDAHQRLRGCQPLHSPFLLIQQLQNQPQWPGDAARASTT